MIEGRTLRGEAPYVWSAFVVWSFDYWQFAHRFCSRDPVLSFLCLRRWME